MGRPTVTALAQSDLGDFDTRRFWAKVDIKGSDECWLWNASIKSGGYGQFKVPAMRSPTYAHRISYVLSVGDIPQGKEVSHISSCPNKHCVNPGHLDLADRETISSRASLGRPSSSFFSHVTWHKSAQKWHVALNYGGRHYSVGLFFRLGDAVDARNERLRNLPRSGRSPERPFEARWLSAVRSREGSGVPLTPRSVLDLREEFEKLTA